MAERAPRWTRPQRVLLALGGSVAALISLAALGHAKPLRPLMAKLLGSSAGCPIALKPEQMDVQREQSSATLGGTALARSRAAGPFVVGVSTRREVESWASASSITCVAELAGTALRCAEVPARLLATSADGPAGADTFARFSSAGVLVGLDVMRAPCGGACSERLAREVVARVERDVGAPTSRHGELDRTYFDAPGLRAASVEFRFTDYAVDVSVSRLAEAGDLVVREQYRAVSPPGSTPR